MRPSVVRGFFILIGVTMVWAVQAAPEKGRPPKCVEVAVPATAQLYLAAQPDGVVFGEFDQAPTNSPVAVSLRALGNPAAVTVSASGVANSQHAWIPVFGPDALPEYGWQTGDFGRVAGIRATVSLALHGVFLNVSRLEVPPTAVALYYDQHYENSRLVFDPPPVSLDPPLMFPFLVGDGVTTGGVTQVYAVSRNADTLYLGLLESTVALNTGGFTAKVCAASW